MKHEQLVPMKEVAEAGGTILVDGKDAGIDRRRNGAGLLRILSRPNVGTSKEQTTSENDTAM